MIVTINLEYHTSDETDISIDLVDHWYESNFWRSSSKSLGATTGPFTYDQGHRKAILWDGAGTVLMEIDDLDMPPYHINDRNVRGRMFYKVKNTIVQYGLHIWYHRKGSEV